MALGEVNLSDWWSDEAGNSFRIIARGDFGTIGLFRIFWQAFTDSMVSTGTWWR